MHSPVRIWLTRPAVDSASLAETLGHHGIECLIAPVMEIAPRPVAPVTDRADALLLTSRHAAHALTTLPNAMHMRPVFCVGDATADASTTAGFLDVRSAASDVLAAMGLMIATLPRESRVLYLCGADTRVDVAAMLAPKGIHVTPLIVYDANALPAPPAPLMEALRNRTLTGVSFFSPRSAQLAVAWLKENALLECAHDIDAYCLSLAVAEVAAAAPWRSVHACQHPTRDAMVKLIVSRTDDRVL